MAETYCGKTCAECAQKATLNCSGCKTGPGRQYGGDCKLAQCCRGKGHEECATCSFNGNCSTHRGKDRMPEYRLKSIEAKKIRAAALARRAPVLGKWLWILFWLIIPSSIASFMTNETIAEAIPSLFVPGLVLSAICSFVYGFILVRLTSEEERYRTAGIYTLVGSGLSVLIAFLSSGPEIAPWTLLISIAAAIISLVGAYNEFTAHSIVLTGVDNKLSERWSSLWKWYIGMYGTMLGSLLVIVIIPMLGLLVTLASAIGLIVVSILKPVYLYRTANTFRKCSAGLPAETLSSTGRNY